MSNTPEAKRVPHTAPVLDNSAHGIDDPGTSDGRDSKIIHELPDTAFNSIIRKIKVGSLDAVNAIARIAGRRIQVGELSSDGLSHPDDDEAISGIPEGSDHFDAGSFKAWVDAIHQTHDESILQLIQIDATARKRISGN